LNNDKETLRQWITEQLEIVDGEETLSIICLKIISGGDEKPIFEMKTGHPKWGNAVDMAELVWGQAHRMAKGIPGFSQFSCEAVFGTTQGTKATRFLPFGIAGATQLGPANGGTAFGGFATEAPTQMGQMMQGMRHQEILAQGYFHGIAHFANVTERLMERLFNRTDHLEKHNAELWNALKEALLAIQNSAVSNAMKTMQMAAVNKLITLAPGLVNMMTGRDLFPPSAVDASLIEAMAANLTPEEQNAAIAWLNSNPNGQPVAAVLSDQLSKHRKRKEVAAKELRTASEGLPDRTYNEGLADAGGTVMRALKGEALKQDEPKAITGATSKIIQEAETIEDPPKDKPAEEPKTNGTISVDSDILLNLLKRTSREQLQFLGQFLGEDMVKQIEARYDQLKSEGKL
jgi:hypothetical protein